MIKDYKLPIFVFFFVLLALVFLKSIIFGLDGLSLWMPLVSEFTRGRYVDSDVIFGGQNLLSIYGALPVWYLFKLIGLNPVQFINLSYFVSLLFIYLPTQIIFNGLSSAKGWRPQLLILAYVILSPIIINRVYAGHLNLIFGIIPLLVSLAMLYQNSKWFDLFSIIALTHAFCIQDYQIIIYHFFYVPILFAWMRVTNVSSKKYFIRLLSVTMIAIFFSLPVLNQMFFHAISENNLRGNENVVYSYVISTLWDIPNLFFSSFMPSFSRNNSFLFHELNYPLGVPLFSFYLTPERFRKLFIIVSISIFSLVLFSANIPPFNFLSNLPLVEIFRVPQRSLMLPVFLLPLFMFSSWGNYLNSKFLVSAFSFFVIGNYNSILGVGLTFICGIVLFFNLLKKRSDIFFGMAFSTLFFGLPMKLDYISRSNDDFFKNLRFINDINDKLNISKKDGVIYFANPFNLHHISAANYLGIATFQGYGHPPKKLFQDAKRFFDISYSPTINDFNLTQFENNPSFQQSLAELGFGAILYFDANGVLNLKNLHAK